MDDNREKLEAVISNTLDAVVPEDQLYLDVAKVAKDLYGLRVEEEKLDVERARIDLESRKLEAETVSAREEREMKVKIAKRDAILDMVKEVGKTVAGALVFGAGLGASLTFEKSYGKSISRTFQVLSRLIKY